LSWPLRIDLVCRKPKTKGSWDPKSDGRNSIKHRTSVHERFCETYNRGIPDSRPVNMVFYGSMAPGLCLSNQHVMVDIRHWFPGYSYNRFDDDPVSIDPGSKYESSYNIEN
jgi:hypothetical protein